MQPASMLAIADPYRFQDLSHFNSFFTHSDGTTRQGGVWVIQWPPILVTFNIPAPLRVG